MAKKSFLDSIDVPEPCEEAWDKMIGDDEKRFCLGCKKDVYNLSAMSRREARKLVARNAGKICVRYARLPNGKLYTTDQKLHQIRRHAPTIAVGVIATTLSLSAMTYAQGESVPHKVKPKDKEIAEQNESKKSKNKIGTSQISFTVKDSTNHPVSNAKVKLTLEKTKQEFIVFTNDEGVAQFSSLSKSRYKVEVSSEVFRKSQRYIQITQTIEPNIKITLEFFEVTGVFVIIEYEIPFFEAIIQEDIKSIQNSISSGFNVNTKDKNGVTALHVAVEVENLEAVKLLIQNKANVNAKDKDGRTPLMMIEESEKPIEILKLLIKNGADVNAQDKNGRTPLMYAVHNEIEEFEAVKLFIKAGAKLETRDKNGNTALLIASDGFSEEIVQALLKAGANPNVKNKDGETPLSLASSQEDIVEILRRYGAIK